MNLIEHAKRELDLAGYDLTKDDYMNNCAKNVMELIKVFSKENHSGLSAQITLSLFNKLVNYKNLTPLTNNPEEWIKLGDTEQEEWQSIRNPECFSADLKTYWSLEENMETDSDGGRYFKNKAQWVKHKLEDYECTSK